MFDLTKIQLGKSKEFFGKFTKNLSWIFLLSFLVILIMEFFVVRQSAQVVIDANQEPEVITKQPGVRINFENYDKVIKRKQQGLNYVPDPTPVPSPFGVAQ